MAYPFLKSPLATFNRLVPKDPGSRLVASDCEYGSHSRHRLDVYAPKRLADERPLPVAVYLYGGSWRSGFRQGYEFVGRGLAAQGLVAAIPDYRLVPEVRFPAFLEDCAAAVAWVRANASRFGGDGDRIVLIGQSAGAYNAAMLALDEQWLGSEHEAIRGFVGLAGPYAFSATANAVTAAAFGPAGPLAEAQPINLVRPTSPPALLLHGAEDKIVRPASSEELARRLRAAGVAATMKVYPHVDHVGSVTVLALPFRRQAPLLAEAVRFTREVTNGR